MSCFRTSREMLWHIRCMLERWAGKDDLGNKTRPELSAMMTNIYELVVSQLEGSDE